jgi:hypothetical protein
MPITEGTRQQINAVLNPRFSLPPLYRNFLVKWMAFNRAYNDLGLDSKKRDRVKVLEYAKTQEDMWPEVSDLARSLVSLECIGGSVKKSERNLLKTSCYVKGATLYLREQLELGGCPIAECRPEKQNLCANVQEKPWTEGKVAALLRLVYQVRCNLVHGDKMLIDQGQQTNRDRDLVEFSIDILDVFLGSLLEEDDA